MGANFESDDAAFVEAKNIPKECRDYLSHHLRNELCSIIGVVELKVKEISPDLYESIHARVFHMSADLTAIGL